MDRGDLGIDNCIRDYRNNNLCMGGISVNIAMTVPSSVKRNRRGKKHKSRNNSINNAARPDILVPTPEYIAQPGGPERHEKTGGYRVIDALERLYSRGLLDTSGAMNEAMYLSARWLEETFRRAGLDKTLSAGDLDRIVTGRSDFSDRLFASESRCDAQKQFAHAVRVLGWYADDPAVLGAAKTYAPYRGNGRIVVGLVCMGYTIEECAGLYLRSQGERACAVAMDRLRAGLMALADLRRLSGGGRSASRASLAGFRAFDRADVAW